MGIFYSRTTEESLTRSVLRMMMAQEILSVWNSSDFQVVKISKIASPRAQSEMDVMNLGNKDDSLPL